MSDQNYFLSTNVIGDFNDPTIDNSGYGALPSAEKNQTYFAYFSSVGSTTPEIIDQTSYFIKYLIDAQGNVVAPQPNSIDILNLISNFENGKMVNVTPLEGTSLFNPILGSKFITDVGKIETIGISQTGSGIKDHTSSISFGSSQASYNYGDFDYGFTAIAVSQNITDTYARVTYSPSYNPSNAYTGSSAFNYTFINDTSTNSNPISFQAQIKVDSAQLTNLGNSGFGFIATQIYLRIVTSSIVSPTTFDYVLNEVIYSVTGQSQTIYIDTPFRNFSNGSRVRVEIKRGYIPYGAAAPITLTDWNDTFQSLPSYIPNLIAYPPYFTTGSESSLYITASATLGNAYTLNMVQNTPTPNALNFSAISKTFTPKAGDYIRFEYNPLKTYKIYEVATTNTSNLIFRLNTPVLSGTNINNFVIYRIDPNAGNQIILNVKKPSGTTGDPLTGFIKPQYMTKELEDNFTTIIQKLAAEGTIQ